MTTENIGLFKAIGSKMDFLNQRQRIIAQNISNSDTPDYKPQDLVPVDFDEVLKDVTKTNGVKNVRLQTTQPGHTPNPGEVAPADARKQKHTYEVAPAGNAVVMEEQLIKSQGNIMDYNLMTNLYQKNVSMIKTALGRQG